MSCPNCGAPSASDATTCAYCRSRLVAVACPSCFGATFVGSQFCPHCGTPLTNPEPTDGAVYKCPGCDGDMKHVKVGAGSFWQCATCGSNWLSMDEFVALCHEREADAALAAAFGELPQNKYPRPGAPVRYVKCPVCGTPMIRKNFGGTSGVIVDVCGVHGTWFQQDELRSVLDFVRRGGLGAGATGREGAVGEGLGIFIPDGAVSEDAGQLFERWGIVSEAAKSQQPPPAGMVAKFVAWFFS